MIDQEEISTPKFQKGANGNFFENSEKEVNNIFERNSTQYSGKRETYVEGQAMGGHGSHIRTDMNKQVTQETGIDANSNGGSTIRFGGSFTKNTNVSKDKKGNFDDKIYSDIRPKNSQGSFGGSNLRLGSNIQVKGETSNNEEDDDPMSFLNDLIDPNNMEHLNTMSEHRKNPQMHRDAEHLRHYYDETPLTVVSEEPSTRHTVMLGNNLSKKYSQVGMFPFESDISSSPSPISGYDKEEKSANQRNFNYSQRSGDKSSLSGGSQNNMVSSEIVGRVIRTKSALLQPKSPKPDFFNQQKRRQTAKLKPNYGMDDIVENSKQDLSQESGNLIPQSPIMRVSSEGSNNIPKRTFLPDDEEAVIKRNQNKNIFFGKFKPLQHGSILHETNSANESDFVSGHMSIKQKSKMKWDQLPDEPQKPEYLITMLSNVTNKKEIQKKKGYVENTIFKLSNEGLYYDGSLKFGKLSGKGLLLLNMVDTTDMNSPEVKENLLYNGDFEKNFAHGKGVLYFKNNCRFEGSFTHGMAHGSGKLFCSNGEVVQGIWLDGKFNY
jgi:hypothetical protein